MVQTVAQLAKDAVAGQCGKPVRQAFEVDAQRQINFMPQRPLAIAVAVTEFAANLLALERHCANFRQSGETSFD